MPRRVPEKAAAILRTAFEQNGYVRTADPEKRRTYGAQVYKKGHEVRLVLASSKEASEIARCLRAVGLKPGSTFEKHGKIVQPIYGRAAVDRFLAGVRST